VSSSEVAVTNSDAGCDGATVRTKALGVGATLSDSLPFRGRTGHRYFRLAVRGRGDKIARIEVRAVRFVVADSPGFRNGARVVHLYQHLLAMASSAVLGVPTLSISGPLVVDALAGKGLAGPFHIDSDHPAEVRVAGASGGRVVDQDGKQLQGPARPGQPFYVDLPGADSQESFTVSAAVGPVHGYEGRTLIGARSDDGPAEFTTLARVAQVWRHAVAALEVHCLATGVGNSRLAHFGTSARLA
jgi:hypothetical protein